MRVKKVEIKKINYLKICKLANFAKEILTLKELITTKTYAKNYKKNKNQ